ncbi:MAG: UDP-N-acetylmuramate dehydrogenase [Candidatus Paceibacterota bacterium]
MFQRNILLGQYSSFKIGGPAKYFFEAKSVEEIIKAFKEWRRLAPHRNEVSDAGVFILGGGTNILFSDKGFDGLVIKPDIKFIKGDSCLLRVGAGVSITQLLNYSITKNLSGLEWAAGIPGTVGGAVRGNAGAFGGETRDVVAEVSSLDIFKAQLKIKKRKVAACCFGYRSSIFKKTGIREIITEVVFKLKKRDKKSIRKIIERNINYRKKQHPLKYPNIGSIFKNVDIANLHEYKNSFTRQNFASQKLGGRVFANKLVPINDNRIPAAYLISEAGLKGVSCGGAIVSPKHPNFIVNFSDATASDVKNLIKLIKKEVYKKFKIKLEEEITYSELSTVYI